MGLEGFKFPWPLGVQRGEPAFDTRFRVEGLGSEGYGLGLRVHCLEFRVWV